MKQSMRCRIAALAVTAAACVGTLFTPVGAHAQEGDYQIFPTPQKVAYQEGSVEFADNVTTVVEDGIDAETEAHLEEAQAQGQERQERGCRADEWHRGAGRHQGFGQAG